MKFTQIPSDTFKNIQLNAGILVTDFDTSDGTIDGIVGATTGGINFTATPTYSDYGEDIDNCPKNTKELKKLESWEAKMAGTFVSVTMALAKMLTAAGDTDSLDATHIIPRNDIEQTDFQDLWWIGDYSDVNTGENAGFIAIKLMNALSTGGFQIQSSDKAKGQFAFEFTGHYSIGAQDTVPFEIYVKEGTSGVVPSITITNTQGQGVDNVSIVSGAGGTTTFASIVVPNGSTITWTIGDTDVANIGGSASVTGSGCAVTGVDEGETTLMASITVNGRTYTDVCAITVTGE